MTRRNCPLNALRSFETSARNLSYVKAAEELFVTPAAISHQVKRLENYLGAQLFRRQPNGLLLTDTGQRLFAELGEVFQQLDSVIDRIKESESKGALTLSVAPMFAVKWLLPRLESFDARYPEIDIRMSTSLDLVDLKRDGFDAAIRLGDGNYPGLNSIKLFDETLTPMCSPRLLDNSPIHAPDDLRNHVLLHDDSLAFDSGAPTWEKWLSAAQARAVNTSRGPHFGQPDHALQAAIDGAGVVLGWRYLAQDDLAAGRLVELFDISIAVGFRILRCLSQDGVRAAQVEQFFALAFRFVTVLE